MSVDGGRPLLGVAGRWGRTEIELARRFDDLHQLIYRRGGIRSSNAALEEVAKLVLIRLWSLRQGGELFAGLFTHPSAAGFRSAFASALACPSLMAVDPAGRAQPVWPVDEPFRLGDGDALTAAAALVADLVDRGRPTVSDPLGTAFDALLAGRYDHTGGLGTYLTPSGVARTMAEIATDLLADDPPDPTGAGVPGFGDPCCGTGRFLVAMLEVLRERAGTQDCLSPILRAGPFGADQSPSAVAKASINMLLYAVDRPLVWTVADSVTDPTMRALFGQIPLVLTNPPFGEGKYDRADGLALATAMLPRLAGKKRLDPSLACLALSVRLLAPGGVLGIVLPDGVINSRAFADLLTGRGQTDQVGLAATVSLPTATFALSGTVAKTSAVFLRRARRPGRVVLARVAHVGYLRQAGRAAPDPGGDQLPGLSRLIGAGLVAAGSASLSITSDDPLVAVVAAGSVGCLDPARLDPDAVRARQWLVERGGIELRELLRVRRVRHARGAQAPFISVLHVDDVGQVDWPAARTHTPATPGVVAGDGDLIISLLNPSRLRAAVIPAGTGPVQVSAEFGVFSASCDPYAVIALLYTGRVRAQLRPLGTGTSSSRRRIDAEDVLSLVVPKLTGEALDEVGAAVRTAGELVTEGRSRLREQFARLG